MRLGQSGKDIVKLALPASLAAAAAFYVAFLFVQPAPPDRLVIATDSSEVITTLSDYEMEVIRTSKRHRTGSDRAAEVLEKLGGDVVIKPLFVSEKLFKLI